MTAHFMDLRARLDAIIAGTAPAVAAAHAPDEESLEISSAIAQCARATLQDYAWGRANPDATACPAPLLPPLP